MNLDSNGIALDRLNVVNDVEGVERKDVLGILHTNFISTLAMRDVTSLQVCELTAIQG